MKLYLVWVVLESGVSRVIRAGGLAWRFYCSILLKMARYRVSLSFIESRLVAIVPLLVRFDFASCVPFVNQTAHRSFTAVWRVKRLQVTDYSKDLRKRARRCSITHCRCNRASLVWHALCLSGATIWYGSNMRVCMLRAVVIRWDQWRLFLHISGYGAARGDGEFFGLGYRHMRRSYSSAVWIRNIG